MIGFRRWLGGSLPSSCFVSMALLIITRPSFVDVMVSMAWG